MNCKTRMLRIVKLLALLLPAIMLILLYPINDFGDSVRIRNFYLEPADSLDVIVLGSSEDYAGYSPVLAYEEYGFTSYPFVFSANAFALFEEQLEEAIRYQSPQIIAVDVSELLAPKSDVDTVLRELTAGIPLSHNKIRMIEQHGDREHILSYYFPFIVNHGKANFKEMKTYLKDNLSVRHRGYSLLKGAITFTGSGENWDGPYVAPINTAGDASTAELPPEVIAECQAVLDACARYPQIRFVFFNAPHRLTTEERYQWYQRMNALGEMIRANGFDFYNFDGMTDQIGIEPETDFYNNYHMNLYGQYKTTRFLCDILTGIEGFSPRSQTPENQANWDTCVEYGHLYYRLFEEEFRSRDPEEFGLWLQESAWLSGKLEEMKQSDTLAP